MSFIWTAWTNWYDPAWPCESSSGHHLLLRVSVQYVDELDASTFFLLLFLTYGCYWSMLQPSFHLNVSEWSYVFIFVWLEWCMGLNCFLVLCWCLNVYAFLLSCVCVVKVLGFFEWISLCCYSLFCEWLCPLLVGEAASLYKCY